MPKIELSAGHIEYLDTGGDKPVMVLLGGLVIGPSLWRGVVESLQEHFRCIVPTLPLGAHRIPIRSDFKLSPYSVAMLIGEFLERLDLDNVTLVENDTGRVQTLIGKHPERVARLVITSCEAFDNYPPGLPGRMIEMISRVPGGITFLSQQLRLRFLRRLPMVFGLMAKRPIPNSVMDEWFHPLIHNSAIRYDLQRYLRATDKNEMNAAAKELHTFNRPVLIAWAAEDCVMPLAHGHRLAELFPQSRLIEIQDSYTLIPEDQPNVLSDAIQNFVDETS